jgi:hypothetical protein
MYSVTDQDGSPGTGGNGGGGTGGGSGGRGGSGGGGGTTCVPGSGTDAGSCNTTFNFENCALYQASIDPDTAQLAFTSIANVRSPVVCGQGAMEISASFSTAVPPDGGSNKGIYGSLSIPYTGDLRGKTVTIHIMAVPATSPMTIFYFYPLTSLNYYPDPSVLRVSPIPSTWVTKSFTFETNDSAMLSQTLSFLLQVRSLDGYVGKIYVDEINISSAADGGTGDGGSDVPASTDAPGTDATVADGPKDGGGN